VTRATSPAARHAATLLGGELRTVTAVAGGDLAEVLSIALTDGRIAIVKGGPDPVAEAAMLAAIAAAGAPTPAVLAVDASVLVLEVLDADGRRDPAWLDLGRVLALLHGAHGPRFGWANDYAFGRLAIANGWSDDWPAFWAERRLVNQLSGLPADLAGRIEALAGDLPARLPAAPVPSLLHGDLWSGNVLVHGTRISGLIDPACYYGDAEVDFAMLRLFATPGPELAGAYGPLAPGHAARRPIYQLWPAIVHLRLFGAAYQPLVERLLSEAGG
jgi:fructosamine-3-kinase